jgi:hypothetical protein
MTDNRDMNVQALDQKLTSCAESIMSLRSAGNKFHLPKVAILDYKNSILVEGSRGCMER